MTIRQETPTPPEWLMQFEVTPQNRRVIESLTTLSNGCYGTRGLLADRTKFTEGVVFANGIYNGDPVPGLLNGPRWTTLHIPHYQNPTVKQTVQLDMYRGVLGVEVRADNCEPLTALMFASSVQLELHGLRADGPKGIADSGPAVEPPSPQDRVSVKELQDGGLCVVSERGCFSASASQDVQGNGGHQLVSRLVVFGSGPNGDCSEYYETSSDQIRRATSMGFDTVLAEHAERWAQRWVSAAVDIPDNPSLQQAVRFAQFHLLSASNEGIADIASGAAIGARGLTGDAYRGHVFWDTDVFVVPALAAMAPRSALAALRYRYHRLAAAKTRAESEGYKGARYPWESAATGYDVTPTQARSLQGEIVPINTGKMEEHIVADIAWSVTNYLRWTGDHRFERGAGAAIVTETARYWQSRVEWDSDGTVHISGVIGPDEYHENVADNAFTNVMAGWNLTQAAKLCERLKFENQSEQRTWRNTAAQIFDCYLPELGIHEQFKGFLELDTVMAASLGKPPLPADALLGRDRIQQVQIIKQADVLMLHHMVPELMRPGSLDRDLDFYLPRTAHGSSLSPAITASVLASAARLDEAREWLEVAARFDLDDLSGTTGAGLHLATMGGLWQAFSQGFFGVRPLEDALMVDPNTPAEWGHMTHRFLYHSASIEITAGAEDLVFKASRPVDLVLGGQNLGQVQHVRAAKFDRRWEAK